jgi:hypothetical protein
LRAAALALEMLGSLAEGSAWVTLLHVLAMQLHQLKPVVYAAPVTLTAPAQDELMGLAKTSLLLLPHYQLISSLWMLL